MSSEITAADCADCKHQRLVSDSTGRQMVCYHPRKAERSHLGPMIGIDAGACRYSGKDCGPSAQWFEPKP